MSSHWSQKHAQYANEQWSEVPSLFAADVVGYFPKSAKVLELGCGPGQGAAWFAGEHNFHVIATDNAPGAIEKASNKWRESSNLSFELLDMTEPFHHDDNSFDVVYADMALHYFDTQTTNSVFSEIHRVLKPGGVLACIVNSVADPEYGTVTKIEKDYFETEGTKKRYFTTKTAREFTRNFEVILCDEKGETYKDSAKGVHGLVRFIGRKI